MPKILPSAERVLRVFEIYAREKRALSNSEMARLLDIADSSCSDLLYTLRSTGYLLRTPKTRLFHPTARLFNVAQKIIITDPMQTFASEALEILSRRSGKSSMAAHLEGTQARIFACEESPRALRYVLNPGTLVELHSSAMGKSLLGESNEEERKILLQELALKPITQHTISDKKKLIKELEQGQKKGYYTNIGEGNESVGAIAVAGHVAGQLTSVALVGPLYRIKKNFDENVETLLKAKKEFFES